jgi:hypothetical protein
MDKDTASTASSESSRSSEDREEPKEAEIEDLLSSSLEDQPRRSSRL